jgi:hypothetical protein
MKNLGIMGDDKRKFLRFECLLPVEMVEVQGRSAEGIKGEIENVSREGIGLIFNLGLNFTPGAVIGFKIMNPATQKECQVKGKIIWSTLAGSKIGIGLKIMNIERSAKAELLDMGFKLWREKKAKSRTNK